MQLLIEKPDPHFSHGVQLLRLVQQLQLLLAGRVVVVDQVVQVGSELVNSLALSADVFKNNLNRSPLFRRWQGDSKVKLCHQIPWQAMQNGTQLFQTYSFTFFGEICQKPVF